MNPILTEPRVLGLLFNTILTSSEGAFGEMIDSAEITCSPQHLHEFAMASSIVKKIGLFELYGPPTADVVWPLSKSRATRQALWPHIFTCLSMIPKGLQENPMGSVPRLPGHGTLQLYWNPPHLAV
ncbi:hypothetical protein FOPG_01493 [Fusarium oxysporum f. sp. conglutinans race 2 54008]|uniref:Uncharacterized protein n=1 Tax=Fusarium oxysporum f. sp. conglutinans race 2 54008 TaxID=1089457 RepID=X0IE62_FUSOX|nr:hypothetical protein FOPG_01493 [Fusarium oxysporum f. sp. conglutinans race 2 54008]